jgi:hypothetical protein
MTMEPEVDGGGTHKVPSRLSVCLSGGGYRATAFGAGAMLAVADSALRGHVASVSSVSGGSITSAVTVGGFETSRDDEPDPMARRVRLLAGLVQSQAIRTEGLLGYGLAPFLVVAVIVVGLFAMPQWLTLEDPSFLFAVVFSIVFGGFLAVTAVPDSLYAVQAAVETLVAEALGTPTAKSGTSLFDIGGFETTRRIFCATDLSSGSHVYLAPRFVLAPGESGRDPHVYVADVVAASACFPGFRPLVFRRDEVGLAGPQTRMNASPRRHRAGGRALLGLLGIIGLATVPVAVGTRILGPLDGGWQDFFLAALALVAGCALAFLSARALWTPGKLVLVDGGVCDNLGAAFALLSSDEHYPELPQLAGAEAPGLMLVVDASKPFVPSDSTVRGLGELVPLRLRGAQRSVLKLLGNANAAARKHVIQLLLDANGPTKGALIAITDVPPASDGLDWPEIAKQTQATPTTLSALDVETTRNLVLQAYRLTQAALVSHGVTMERVRSGNEINALVGGTVPQQVNEILDRRNGPYARQAVRVRRLSQAIHFVLSAVAITAVGWWWWVTQR